MNPTPTSSYHRAHSIPPIFTMFQHSENDHFALATISPVRERTFLVIPSAIFPHFSPEPSSYPSKPQPPFAWYPCRSTGFQLESLITVRLFCYCCRYFGYAYGSVFTVMICFLALCYYVLHASITLILAMLVSSTCWWWSSVHDYRLFRVPLLCMFFCT